jgi:ketosteroid isomerase-like protein
LSRENVEVVRAFFKAWNAADMDAVRDLHDPEVIQRPPSGWPGPGPFVGREEVMRQYAQLRGAWDSDTLEPISDFIDAGDRVVVTHRWHGEGRGPDLRMDYTAVWTILEGKIFHQEFFSDLAEAVKTLGLSESNFPADR